MRRAIMADRRRTVGAGRAARAARAHAAREARLATLIRQFERDTAILDDAVAGWLGASRAELGSNELRYEEMLRCGRLTPGEPLSKPAQYQHASPPYQATSPPYQATSPPDRATSPPDLTAALPDRTAALPGQTAPVPLPAGGWSLLQQLFGEPTAAAGPRARYSAAETAALIRFFSAAHERRMERVRRIRSAMADDRPGTA
jgi:hypothetical protein